MKKKILYVVVPVLFAAVVYFGGINNSMSEVVAKTIRTLTKTYTKTVVVVRETYVGGGVEKVVTETKTWVNTYTNIEVPDDDIIEQVVPVWKPTTPEEIELASWGSAGVVKFSCGEWPIRITSEIQGPEFHKALLHALEKNYKVANTYNIVYVNTENENDTIYQISEPVTITMEIPQNLIQEGRTFKMICISEGGKAYTIPVTLNDDGTITFTTKYFYAYALVYTDK